MPLQNPRIHLPKLLTWILPKIPRPRNIRRPILILPPRINEYRLCLIQIFQPHAILRGTIMNNRAIAPHTRNGREGYLFKTRLLRPVSRQDLIHLHLANRPSLHHNGMFQPRHEIRHGHPIDNVRTTHPLHLGLVLNRLHRRHGILDIDQDSFRNDTAECIIGTGVIEPHLIPRRITHPLLRQMGLDTAENIPVRLDDHIRSFQMRGYLRWCDLLVVAVQCDLIVGDGGVGNADGTGLDIAHAADVEEVGDVVEGAEDCEGGFLFFHFGADFGDFVGDCHSGVFHRMNTEWILGKSRPPIPNRIDQIWRTIQRINLGNNYP
mmetsp:Transcript_34416/g.61811  ORF Transcript_34416/g.61811 Transcript_34416/m.61811 type:complete len:321 (-) Transcript_34416:876-1838(-)